LAAELSGSFQLETETGAPASDPSPAAAAYRRSIQARIEAKA
jgi:hypothetical protein